ncbi:MAG: peptidase T [Lachnospiraceae bacterium]|nr:peptidase T [Lachnospiraceae bacterium]
MKAYERLLEYVKIPTPSFDESGSVPSSREQLVLAELLKGELEVLGLKAEVDEYGYCYGVLEATEGYEDRPALGWIAHMDTVSDFPWGPVQPVLHPHYDGGDVPLGDSGRVLSVKQFPHLKTLRGRTLITTDGTTVLGADDKAGIAEIMVMLEEVQKSGMPHGRIPVAFTPDEEIGAGADHFDVERFGADFAFTMDGGAEGEIEYENFNAASAVIRIAGVNVHPGDAKDFMINAALVGTEFAAMLPKEETPAHTEGYEGFYHLCSFEGDVSKAELNYILRDHDLEKLMEKKKVLEDCMQKLNEQYGEGTVSMDWTDEYRNMKEQIRDHMHLITNARMAALQANITPVTNPIRGGTDGARLSFMGLPCPNLGTGGYAFHGPYEHITVEGMEKAVQMMLHLVEMYAGSGTMDCNN